MDDKQREALRRLLRRVDEVRGLEVLPDGGGDAPGEETELLLRTAENLVDELERSRRRLIETNVQLVSLRDHPFLYGAIPSKIAAVLASGLPMICTAPGDAADLVRESGAGWIAPPEDEDALAACLRRSYASTPGERAVMGSQGRRFYQQRLSRDVSLGQLERIITRAAVSARSVRAG